MLSIALLRNLFEYEQERLRRVKENEAVMKEIFGGDPSDHDVSDTGGWGMSMQTGS